MLRKLPLGSLLLLCFVGPVLTQPPGGPGGPGGPGARETVLLVARFDDDKDGILGRGERERACQWLRDNPVRGRGPRPNRGMGSSGDERTAPEGEPLLVGRGDVPHAPERNLFDITVLRTLFLQFADPDWHDELTAFYGTDVEVSADGSLDGRDLRGILVRYRGNSSFMMTGAFGKKSLNLSFDRAAPEGALNGYKTLNLLNGHADPSYLDAPFRVATYPKEAGAKPRVDRH